MIENITGLENLNSTLEQNSKILVDVWAEWCGPCKMMLPVLEEVANSTDVKIIKVDADTNKDILDFYQIKSIPTLLYYSNGKLINKTVGFIPKSQLMDKITKL